MKISLLLSKILSIVQVFVILLFFVIEYLFLEGIDDTFMNDENVELLNNLFSYFVVISLIANIIFSLIWISKAYKIAIVNSSDGLSHFWSWLSWFIPIINLIFPYFILNKIWKRFNRKRTQSNWILVITWVFLLT